MELLRQYMDLVGHHPNQFLYHGRALVSTFAGDQCTFGQASVVEAWRFARAALERVCPVSLHRAMWVSTIFMTDVNSRSILCQPSSSIQRVIIHSRLWTASSMYLPIFGSYTICLDRRVLLAVEWLLAYTPCRGLTKRGRRVSCLRFRPPSPTTPGWADIHGSCVPLVFHGKNFFYNTAIISIFIPLALWTRLVE